VKVREATFENSPKENANPTSNRKQSRLLLASRPRKIIGYELRILARDLGLKPFESYESSLKVHDKKQEE
jgi:hypothetical protein